MPFCLKFVFLPDLLLSLIPSSFSSLLTLVLLTLFYFSLAFFHLSFTPPWIILSPSSLPLICLAVLLYCFTNLSLAFRFRSPSRFFVFFFFIFVLPFYICLSPFSSHLVFFLLFLTTNNCHLVSFLLPAAVLCLPPCASSRPLLFFPFISPPRLIISSFILFTFPRFLYFYFVFLWRLPSPLYYSPWSFGNHLYQPYPPLTVSLPSFNTFNILPIILFTCVP